MIRAALDPSGIVPDEKMAQPDNNAEEPLRKNDTGEPQRDVGGQANSTGRLNGWKEISAYLGKSVRTGQRWEHELKLPVHRIRTAGGEIVFAFRNEIDAWLTATESLRAEDTDSNGSNGVEDARLNSAASEAEQADGRITPAAAQTEKLSPWARGFAGLSMGLLIVAVLAGAWYAIGKAFFPGFEGRLFSVLSANSARRMTYWRVENEILKVFDESNTQLWQHTFTYRLLEPWYRRAHVDGRLSPGVVSDLENDGSLELVFIVTPSDSSNRSLFCFNQNGSVRWAFQPQPGRVHFGGKAYEPPYFPLQFLVTSAPDGRKSVWLVSLHNLDFPALLQRLDAQGKVKDEYWSNGHITTLAEAQTPKGRVLLVGATNNESYGASLAILDQDRPSGFAPAESAKYRCDNCGGGPPLAFLVFPPTEISRLMSTRPFVSEIRVGSDGLYTISVLHAANPLPGMPDLTAAPVFYELDSAFHLRSAEVGDEYRRWHSGLELTGRVKHRFGARDEAELFPVLSWSGEKFEKVLGPQEAAARR